MAKWQPLLIVAVGLALSSEASAHPHVWVTVKTTVQFKDNAIVGLQQNWTFDEFYAARLKQIGVPCLIEADIRIPTLQGGPERHMIDVYLGNRQSPPSKEEAYVASTDENIPAAQIKRIITPSVPDFEILTGCAGWNGDPLV